MLLVVLRQVQPVDIHGQHARAEVPLCDNVCTQCTEICERTDPEQQLLNEKMQGCRQYAGRVWHMCAMLQGQREGPI
jgi:hypothetical protein